MVVLVFKAFLKCICEVRRDCGARTPNHLRGSLDAGVDTDRVLFADFPSDDDSMRFRSPSFGSIAVSVSSLSVPSASTGAEVRFNDPSVCFSTMTSARMFMSKLRVEIALVPC